MNRNPNLLNPTAAPVSTAGASPAVRLNSIRTAQSILGIGRTLLYDEIRSGRLSAVKVGRRTMVPETSLADYVANLPRAGGPRTTR